MADIRPRAVFLGRRSERALLDALLARVRAGRSDVLVLRGEAGIGKTALLDYLIERASDCRVARAVGVQADTELAFAGLQQLCGPLLDQLDRLPAPQRDAILVAFGLTVGPVPDRFLVGLGVLGLLSKAAEDRPLVCIVDDAQWLDRSSAQVLAFVARRLLAESVALVFAVREPSEQQDLAGLPELVVEGLEDADARALLASVISGRLDEQAVQCVIAEIRGNPLALLELPRGLTAAEFAGGFGVSASVPLSVRLEESFLERLRLLPTETQQLLLVAAAESVGDPVLLWRAAEQIGLGVEAAAPAEAVGLLELSSRVRFRHPLVRSAIYRAATLADRQAAHRALAEATDPKIDPDRRAWHRAQAALGPDEDVADELERSAKRALARGGLAAAAAFLERAAALSPEPGSRARRALAAAQAKEQAGAPHAALTLLATVETGPLDELQRGMLERLRGQIEVHLHRGRDAPPQLLKAARRLESLDIGLARETYLEALYAATVVGRLGSGVLEVAQAARAAPPLPPPQPAADLLLDGLAVRFIEGYVAGASILKRALTVLRNQEVHGDQEVRWLSLALRTAGDLFDDEMWHVLVTRQIQLARDTGALSVLPLALINLGHLRIFAGEFDAAAALIDEADAITAATANASFGTSGKCLIAVYQAEEVGASVLIETAVREATARGEGMALTALEYASAVLHNGLGRYDAALSAAQQASAQDDLSHSVWALPELVEAATRVGQAQVAAAALQQLSERARASGTDWALGMEARSRALAAEGRLADDLYREAIDRLGETRVALELARARLLYGEWLRRERRRIEAREQLRNAYEMFAGMGAHVFAQRTRRELLATGERARRRAVETTTELTPQELQVANMARDGGSNQEIGGQLFISPKTVEYHLHKAFTKLGISSRHQLDRVLGRD
jgi:DNA-binding CsgD family transcriptional regulator